MKKTPKKIQLNRETLLSLDNEVKQEDLECVLGGYKTGKRTCECP